MGRGDYIPHQPMVSPSMSTMSSASYAKANAMSRQSEQMMATTKAVNQLNKVHEAQLINYLKATGIKIGLLVNFGEKLEFRRKIY
ncbi:MAG: GxxExxY protein [Candidatus Peribacteraceae bacterium]|nr:GxxExxY protein [Candidatus Peribacteraceae bacterium]